MKSSFLTGLLLMCGFFLAACANNMHGTTDTTTTSCTVVNGQLVSSNGQACSGLQATCTQQGLAYNSLTNSCVSGTGTGIGTGGGYPGGGYGVGTTVSCDYWNQVYAGYGYYVPMQVQGQYYCVNIQQYVPSNYMQYYTGGTIYGQSCQYGYNCSSGAYSSGSSMCFGIGGGAGDSYGISGYFSVCL